MLGKHRYGVGKRARFDPWSKFRLPAHLLPWSIMLRLPPLTGAECCPRQMGTANIFRANLGIRGAGGARDRLYCFLILSEQKDRHGKPGLSFFQFLEHFSASMASTSISTRRASLGSATSMT